MIYYESYPNSRCPHSLCKYDVVSNTWTPFLEEVLRKIRHLRIDHIEFDWMKRRIFILTDLRHHRGTYILKIDHPFLLRRYHQLPQGELVNVNGSIQCVHDERRGVWNDKRQRWQPINLTLPLGSPREIYHSQVIHVPSKNMLLMFRWSYNSSIFASERSGAMLNVWRHRIGSHESEWTVGFQQSQFPGIPGSVILSSNEQFVIIAQLHFWILDIRNDHRYETRKSAVPISVKHGPGILAHTDCRFGSETIVSGFARRLDMNIPVLIVNMVTRYYSIERIHWIKRYGKPNHLMLPLKCFNENQNTFSFGGLNDDNVERPRGLDESLFVSKNVQESQRKVMDGFKRVTALRKVRTDQITVYNKSKGAQRDRLHRNIAATEMEIVSVMETLLELSPTEVRFAVESDSELRGLLEARKFKAPWMEFN